MPFAAVFRKRNPSLGYVHFRYYLLMRLTIILALNMQATIISYYVYQLTHDKLALGMIGLWEVIPAVGCSLFSGHFVDLREKKGLLVGCISCYVLLSLFFVGLSWAGSSAVLPARGVLWLLYGGIFVGGALRAFVSPASFALMGMLVPKNLYPNATTWSSGAWQTGAVLGPLMGGFCIAFTDFQYSLAVVGAMELITLAAILKIPRQPILNKEKEPVMKSLGEGIRFVFRTQVILAALSLDMFAVLFGGAVALLPIYAVDILQVGELGYGWMRAAPGIGSVITLAILSYRPLKKDPGTRLMLYIAGFGLTTIVFGVSGYAGTQSFGSLGGMPLSCGFLVAVTMLLLGGVFDAVSVVIRSTILQVYTPDHMRGRVAAVNTMFISSSNELGAMESGLTAKWLGTVPAVVLGGCMTVAVVVATWFTAPTLRKLDLHGTDKKDAG